MLLSGQEVEVEVVAEKVTASLNQVTGAEDLKLFNAERITPNNPTNNFHHQAWSTTGSIGIGLDGKINPSITPVFERDGVRTSATLSRDLFEGMNMLHNWLEKTFREDPTILPKEDFIKPIKEIKSEKSTDEEQATTKQDGKSTDKNINQDGTKQQSSPQKVSDLKNKITDLIDKSKGLTPWRKAQLKNDIEKLTNGNESTRKEIIAKYEKQTLELIQKNDVNALKKIANFIDKINIFGAREAQAGAIADDLIILGYFALITLYGYQKSNNQAGHSAIAMKIADHLEKLPSKVISLIEKLNDLMFEKTSQGDVLDKQTPKKQKVNDQSGATPPAPGFDPDENPEEHKVNMGHKFNTAIEETNTQKGHFISKYKFTEEEALDLGKKWLGKGYKEIGKPGSGVYRSSDGFRQFRIDSSSLRGIHSPHKSHFHLEKLNSNGKIISNNHIVLK